MQRLRRWSLTGVEVKFLSLFVRVEDFVEVAVSEEHVAAKERMRGTTSETLHARNHGCVHLGAPEIHYQLVVVDLADHMQENTVKTKP